VQLGTNILCSVRNKNSREHVFEESIRNKGSREHVFEGSIGKSVADSKYSKEV
jgi:hypothetical protein